MKNNILIIILSILSTCLTSCCPGAHHKAGIYTADIQELQEVKFYRLYTYFNPNSETKSLYAESVNSDIIRNTDTLRISFEFNYLKEKIGMNTFQFSLINSAYACSPAQDMYSLKYKIDSVLITSDTIYDGIAAGNSLNALFFKSSNNSTVNLNDLITEINQEGGINSYYLFDFSIETNKKSGSMDKHKLFIKLYKSNNEIISGETNPFAWY